jgi:hypothetical protein
MITKWKKHAIDQLPSLFSRKPDREPEERDRTRWCVLSGYAGRKDSMIFEKARVQAGERCWQGERKDNSGYHVRKAVDNVKETQI